MAYGLADLQKLWSATTIVELREESLWLNLCTQNEDTARWRSGIHTVNIPAPDWAGNDTPNPSEGVVAESRARGGNWATPRRGDQDVIPFTRSGGFSTANEVLYEDAMELPWPVVERTRSRQIYTLRRQIDHGIYSRVNASVPSGAGNTIALGSNANSISRTPPYAAANNNARGLPREILRQYASFLERQNVDGPGDDVGQKYVVMAPEVFAVLLLDMEQDNYSWDLLTEDLLRNNSILGSRGFRGRLHGLDLFSWNGIGIPGAGGNWEITCGVKAAQAAEAREPVAQYFDPNTNQVSDAPGHLLRQVGDYAHAGLVPSLMRKYTIDGGA